jgi:hypothetical protein
MAARLALILLLVGAVSTFALETQPQGPTWVSLSAEQKNILDPIAPPTWDTLTKLQKTRLINAAKHYPKETPEEQARFRQHLIEWTQLPKEKRQQARENFKNFHKLPPEKKESIKNQWDSIQPAAPEGASP